MTFAAEWMKEFAAAMTAGDARAAVAVMEVDSHWRDLLAFTWHLYTVSGREKIERAWERTLPDLQPRDFQISAVNPPRRVVRAGLDIIEVDFAFETEVGECSGVARIREDASGAMRAWTLMTNLEEIRGHEEHVGARRPRGEEYSRSFGGPNWLDRREAAVRYADHEPEVLVIGGGQCGLAVAARLGQIDVDTLIIERNERIGDNWRNRYHSLTLHNQTWVNHLPYLPFPETFPVYIPKDKLANWFELYAEAMELNVWTGTEFLGGSFDEDAGRWNVTVRTEDVVRTLHPAHIVMAAGVSGRATQPDMPGLNEFEGSVTHAANFTSGAAYQGRNVVVFGTGNSGHDLAQELHASGANVTMVQRGSITVSNVEPSQVIYSIYGEGLSTAIADRLVLASPYDAIVLGFQELTRWLQEPNQELIDGLNQIGMLTDDGHDQTGFQMKYMRRGGGYYLNVGCSELLINGDVELIHRGDIERIASQGIQMHDGTVVDADDLMFAIGYENQSEMVRGLFGDAVADRVGKIWGWDEGGEVANMWKRTSQPNLYFHAGSLAQGRILSKHIALLIKARQLGMIEAGVPERPDVAERALTAAD